MACETYSTSGSGLVVYIDATCSSVLKDDSITMEALPLQVSPSEMELRDGSIGKPIKLGNLQKYTALSVPVIVVQKADGTLVAWNGPTIPGRKKVVLDNGAFILKDDLNTDLFDNTMCVGTCMDINYLIGARDVFVRCAGLPDTPAVQLIKIPVCFVGEEPEPTP
jgi:hypothetical protein